MRYVKYIHKAYMLTYAERPEPPQPKLPIPRLTLVPSPRTLSPVNKAFSSSIQRDI